MDVSALWDIRVRTPRLELRLPSDDELEEFFDLAAAGIHPPEDMPFAFNWTDTLEHDAFVEFHRSAWRDWSPELWRCHFVTFLDSRVIGTQGVESKEFAATRTVGTGSWLGQAFQGRGYGTEQRAAVLEFAFRGLGAKVAITGAVVSNSRSQRISEKLGYTVTGMSEVSPRGEPVQHYDYRLENKDWRCPIPVEIMGLDEAVPLFGA
jgi:RimJ/RimL family protein N-acetyltransferase